MLPRKAQRASGGIDADILASMRPRHCCRGRRRRDRRSERDRGRASMRPRHCCRGRLIVLGCLLLNYNSASMRPRHCCRGRPVVSSAGCTVMSSCFNEAAALLPRKAYALAEEIEERDAHASMRPRHCCRGRPMRSRDRPSASGQASMRPRHCCRGRRASSSMLLQRTTELQ